jgi:hypothetical protein
MNQAIATLKTTVVNPVTHDKRREAAISQLRAIAADSKDFRATEASLVLRELNIGALPVSTETVHTQAKPSASTVAKAKAVINDPSSTPEQREAAWIKLKTPEDIPAEVRALENKLLEELHCGSLADVDACDLHKFCSEKEWKNPAVKALWFDRWLPAYWKTEQGSRKLAELETYGLMHNNPGKRSETDLESFALIAELRRRIRVDDEFCGMLVKGVSEGKLPIELVCLICSDIWAEPTPEPVSAA